MLSVEGDAYILFYFMDSLEDSCAADSLQIADAAMKTYGDGDGCAWLLRYGGKKLQVTAILNGASFLAVTHISNETQKPVPGSTTALYGAFKILIQRLLEEQGKPITYHFNTTNANMKKWASSKGKEMFGWKIPSYTSDRLGLHVTFRKNETESSSAD